MKHIINYNQKTKFIKLKTDNVRTNYLEDCEILFIIQESKLLKYYESPKGSYFHPDPLPVKESYWHFGNWCIWMDIRLHNNRKFRVYFSHKDSSFSINGYIN